MIRIAYAALNTRTTVIMSIMPALIRKTAEVPEIDFSGIIIAVSAPAGSLVKPNEGSPVVGQLDRSEAGSRGISTQKEWIMVAEDEVDMAVVPDGTSLQDAACFGMVGVASLQMLRRAGLALSNAGVKVLVNGASGAVGTLLVQIVKATSATFRAVCSAVNGQLVKRLDADEIVAYRSVDLPTLLQRFYCADYFEAILNTIGDQQLDEACPAFLKPDGTFVSIGGYGGSGAVSMLLGMAKNMYMPPALGRTPREWVLHQNKTNGDGLRYPRRVLGERAGERCGGHGTWIRGYGEAIR